MYYSMNYGAPGLRKRLVGVIIMVNCYVQNRHQLRLEVLNEII